MRKDVECEIPAAAGSDGKSIVLFLLREMRITTKTETTNETAVRFVFRDKHTTYEEIL